MNFVDPSGFDGEDAGSTLSSTSTTLGIGSTFANEQLNFTLSDGFTMLGSNFKLYANWHGNQYVSEFADLGDLSKICGGVNLGSSFLSTGIDAYSWYNGNLSAGQFTINSTVTAISFFAGPEVGIPLTFGNAVYGQGIAEGIRAAGDVLGSYINNALLKLWGCCNPCNYCNPFNF